MSNRLNRTLSASSNRLNLGSRSLALTAGFGDVVTLCSRHTHPQGQRTVMMRPEIGDPIDPAEIRPKSKWAAAPGSPLVAAWPLKGPADRPSEALAEAPPVLQEVVVNDRTCRTGRSVQVGSSARRASRRPSAIFAAGG